MRKAASIYFLVIALPAIGVGLYGEYMFYSFLQMPALAPEDPDYSDRSRLVWDLLGLAVLIIGGMAFLPGYWRQIFRPTTPASQLFWWLSAGYNTLLMMAFGAFIFPMGLPPDIDLSIILIFGLFFSMPSIGLLLSCLCAVKRGVEIKKCESHLSPLV